MNENEQEIKRANRKALPKFIGFMVVLALVGYVFGYLAAAYGLSSVTGALRHAGSVFARFVAPWLLIALALLVPAVCVPAYRKAKKLLGGWDGEDETCLDTVNRKLSAVLWITGTSAILDFFLIAAVYSEADFDSAALYFASLAAFLAVMFESLILAQKCVDRAKQMNPEKTASIYDMRFQKKWMASCDEAEQILVGKCAFKAYSATGKVCAVLAGILATGAVIFDIGFLPSLVVCIIWVVNQSVYYREVLRYSKAGSKLS